MQYQPRNLFALCFIIKKFEENQLSVPTTYEEFLNVCKTLKNNQVTPMILAATDSWIPAQFVQQISNGIAGMDLYDGICDGTRKWNDPAHVEASKEVQSMIDQGYFQEGMLGMTAEEVQSQFKQGKAAMYFQGAWDASTILDVNTSTITDCVGAFTRDAAEVFLRKLGVAEPYQSLLELPRETELAIREKDGRQYIFVLNYSHEPVQICLKQPMRDMYAGTETEGTIELKAYETKVFLKK